LAAAEFAEDKGLPPDELRLAFRCQQWGTLPHSGGLFDQPAGLVERMTTAINVYNAVKAWRSAAARDAGDFVKNNPDAWRIVKTVMELRANG
jgi:hypothetical protein